MGGSKRSSVKRLTRLLFLLIILILNPTASAQRGQPIPIPILISRYSGGTGEPNNPFQIATAADLILLGETRGDHDKDFILTADIDLGSERLHTGADENAVIPMFLGSFDGKGFRIENLRLASGSYSGLFGILSSYARVLNLGIINADIGRSAGGRNAVGILAGRNDGIVYNCNVSGQVHGRSLQKAGGLVGFNTGTVMCCRSEVIISGGNDVGGLVGDNAGGQIAFCHSSSDVTGQAQVGGLVGYNRGVVIHSYSHGTVLGNFNLGGLAGANGNLGEFVASSASGSVTCCYSTSAVHGHGRSTGGLVGGGENLRRQGSFVGTVVQSFWDMETSGQDTSMGGSGKTTAEMQDAQVYQAAGWDWTGEINNGTSEIWNIPEGGGYPALAILNESTPPPLQGQGTAENPYIIADARGLGVIVHYNPCAHFQLAESIDLTGILWATSVIPCFAGQFDGGGHTISNLRIEGGGFLGFLGVLHGATVKDIRIVDAHVVGSGDYVGGLCGMSRSSREEFSLGSGWRVKDDDTVVSGCTFQGEVRGGLSVGGLLGRSTGVVRACSSTAIVSGSEDVGGLVGMNGALLRNCYSDGAVEGSEFVGGLVGRNRSWQSKDFVINCYSTSLVTGVGLAGGLVGFNERGQINQSFWDAETSGQPTSAGGTNLTTPEMQTATTFLSAGWDFVGETENGPNDVWRIIEGETYPLLSWQKYGGGAGEPNAPFLIYTAEHLNTLGAEPDDWDKDFKLMADIDLSAYTGDQFNLIGSSFPRRPFTGVFDGGGHVVHNFHYSASNSFIGIGLFAYVNSPNAIIRNLGLVDPNVVVERGWDVGLLVGHLEQGTIHNCYVENGHVTGFQRVGGLVGACSGVITRCHTEAVTVSGDRYVGGLVGHHTDLCAVWEPVMEPFIPDEGLTTTRCSETIPGLIKNCSSTGAMAGANYIGGLVGMNKGTIQVCYAISDVAGEVSVGGLVGHNQNDGVIANSHAKGSVSGDGACGGLVGGNRAKDGPAIINCYSTGKIMGLEPNGGLIGWNQHRSSYVMASVWDTETSGLSVSDGGEGKTTAEMHNIQTYLDLGWDFVNECENGTEGIWWIFPGEDYPRLWWEGK